MEPITYKGRKRDGTSSVGIVTGVSPADLMKRLYDKGWRWAVAMRGTVEVGGISYDEARKRRIWWGED